MFPIKDRPVIQVWKGAKNDRTLFRLKAECIYFNMVSVVAFPPIFIYHLNGHLFLTIFDKATNYKRLIFDSN